MISKEGFQIEDEKWANIAIKRLARRRGKEGFANARDVRNLYEKVVTRHAEIQVDLEDRGKVSFLALQTPFLFTNRNHPLIIRLLTFDIGHDWHEGDSGSGSLLGTKGDRRLPQRPPFAPEVE